MSKNSQQRIVLVDDNKSSLLMGKTILDKYYKVYALPSAEKMFEFLNHITPALILLDIEMPGMNGYEAITILKGNKHYADIPVIFVTSRSSESDEYEGLAHGAIDYITKPFSEALLLQRIENHLLIESQKAYLRAYNDNLLKMVNDKIHQVFGLQNAIITTVAELVEFRDTTTGCHISRTQKYIERLVDQLIADGVYADELVTWDIEPVLSSSQLHDVGKIGISDFILNKPGRLTPAEFAVMKTHVQKGVDAIQKMESFGDFGSFLECAKVFAGSHHERWDGSGYPLGLRGLEIPLEGRIMAISDVYDALISARPYKKAFSYNEAARIIIEGSGMHFDPLLVGVFDRISGDFAIIAETYKDCPCRKMSA